MIEPPSLGQRGGQVLRSQLAMEIAVAAYAFLGTLLILRAVLLVLGVRERDWAGTMVFGVTDRVLAPVASLPGAGRTLAGQLTLADITAVLVAALLPLALLAASKPR